MTSTGHREERTWTSAVTGKTTTIEVFIPDKLSDTYRAKDAEGMAKLEQRLLALGNRDELASVGHVLIRSEGIASSRVEGLVMSTRGIYEASLRPDDVDDRTARQIVANMEMMAEVMNPTTPLTHDDLHRWHRSLIESDLRMRPSSGQYRTQQNWIGGRIDSPVGAEFVPPPHDLVPPLMDDLLEFVNGRSLAPVVQASVAHAQFETIHPYTDGNGRVGRALIYWVLANRGVVSKVAPPISPMIVESADDYVAGLTAYRNEAPSDWIDTFVAFLNSAVAYSMALADAIGDLHADWQERVADIRAGAVDHDLVGFLVTTPVVDAALVAKEFGLTAQAAGDALGRLEQRGILVQASLRRGRRGRPAKVYDASELFGLLDEHPQALVGRE